MTSLSDQYEMRYPNTGCSEAQKHERMERLLFKEEASTGRRTTRQRGVVVPELPWQREEVSSG